jgi:hypothetical protein
VNESLRQTAREARAELASGTLRGARLAELIRSIPLSDRDVWVDELVGFGEPPPDVDDLPRGSVPYLPCGVDEILALPIGPEDALVDLGSGVGRVVILAHLVFGVRASGIEIQEPLVRIARERSRGLPGVSFAHADASETALDGSVFFLYAPFNGELLTRVLARLAEVARRRPIVVCTVGVEFHHVPWMRKRVTSNPGVSVYDSVE